MGGVKGTRYLLPIDFCNIRTKSTIQTPTLNLLLYGSSNLSVDINKAIFDKVHKFILDTKRF